MEGVTNIYGALLELETRRQMTVECDSVYQIAHDLNIQVEEVTNKNADLSEDNTSLKSQRNALLGMTIGEAIVIVVLILLL